MVVAISINNATSLAGVGVKGTLPTDGQALKYKASDSAWEPSSEVIGVSSVSNSDGTLSFSPTAGAVVGSINLASSNTWLASQTVTVASGSSTGLVINYNGTGYALAIGQSPNVIGNFIVDNAFNVHFAGQSADSAHTLENSTHAYFESKYWNGTIGATLGYFIQSYMDATTPAAHLSIGTWDGTTATETVKINATGISIASGLTYQINGTNIFSTAQTIGALFTFGNNISIGGAQFNVTALASGNIIQYNGTNWVNIAPKTMTSVTEQANTSEKELTTTVATTIATYTPASQGNKMVLVYARVVTAATVLTLSVSWTDSTGAQTYTWLSAVSESIGSYNFLPLYINATAAAITVSATAGTANQVYVSGSIIEIT